MPTDRFTFPGHAGHDLAARLDLPCPALAVQEDLQSLTDGVIDKLQEWSER